jgi:nitrate reductase gamma subunit
MAIKPIRGQLEMEGKAMNFANELAFEVFPYLCLTVFTVGHALRYITDRYSWNARSSEFLEKKSLKFGSILFHWGILGTLLGHTGGLLIPQAVLDRIGIDSHAHLALAFWSGLLVGVAALVGSATLCWRRIRNDRIKAAGTVNDLITIVGLILVIALGVFNVVFGHYNVLYSVAPWIRGIVTFRPDAGLMMDVPMSYKLHILLALTLLAFSPFSRLVHIWSAPVFYFFRRPIVFRRTAKHSKEVSHG